MRCEPPGPVELETLHLEFAVDAKEYRVGQKVRVTTTVTRFGKNGSPEAVVGGQAPLRFAFVDAQFSSAGRKIAVAGQETEQDGRAILQFTLPANAEIGPVDIAATVRYVTVDSFDCTGPVIVEHGEGQQAGLVRIVR